MDAFDKSTLLDLESNFLIPSPVEHVSFNGFSFMIKRDDLIHPIISGNKWRKLKYTLIDFANSHKTTIVSCGSIYSNFLNSLAYVCWKLNIPLTIYTTNHQLENEHINIKDFINWNAKLIYVDRKSLSIKKIELQEHPKEDEYYIPEGGDLLFALHGVEEMYKEMESFAFTTYAIGSGTGRTANALANIALQAKVIAVHTVKMHTFQPVQNLTVIPSKTSFAHCDKSYLQLLSDFYNATYILLDPIYTGRVLEYIMSHKQIFDDNFCFIHTGGLQAWRAYRNRYIQKCKSFTILNEAIDKLSN